MSNLYEGTYILEFDFLSNAFLKSIFSKFLNKFGFSSFEHRNQYIIFCNYSERSSAKAR